MIKLAIMYFALTTGQAGVMVDTMKYETKKECYAAADRSRERLDTTYAGQIEYKIFCVQPGEWGAFLDKFENEFLPQEPVENPEVDVRRYNSGRTTS